MNIPTAVSALIKESDCVIIPGVGGFISNRKPARITGRNNQIFPPRKEVSFNTQINQSDGLLINYIAEKEEIDFSEAKDLVEELVDQMMESLEAGDTIELKGLGELYWNSNDVIEFKPKVTGNILSDSYGLEEFCFPTYEKNSNIIQIDNKETKTTFKISISSNRVKQALVGLPIAAILALYPIYRSPLSHENRSKVQEANLAVTTHFSTTKDESKTDSMYSISILNSNSSKTIDNLQSSIKNISRTSSVTEKPEVEHIEVEEQYKPFIVIAGCFEKYENADRLIAKLKNEGYEGQIKVLQNGLFRVSLGNYSGKDEALDIIANPEIRSNYPNMWLAFEK